MFNKIKKLKYTPIFLATFLVACGGGGGSGDSGGSSSAQISNAINLSGTVEVDAGKNLALESRVNALRSSVASHTWVISQISGETALASNSPTIVDKDCATASKKPGAPATGSTVGATGSSNCFTSLVVPSTAKASEWSVRNLATASDGNSATGAFTLKIKSIPITTTGFSVITPNAPQIQEINKLAQLSASYVVKPGLSVESIKYKWTQVSGPAVTLSAANTASAFFLPKSGGEYVFKVSATVSINGKEETQEGDIVVNVADAVAVTYFEVQAGDVQIGKIGAPVSLIGKVTGTAAAGTLTYEWSQVSGPQQAIFANEKTLNASFIPQSSGIYVFQLKVSNAAGFKTATTTVAIDAGQSTTPFFAVSAGDVQFGALKTIVALKSTVTSGTPAPTNLTYKWEQKSGTPVALSNATSAQASFIPTVPGQYEFEVSVTSNGITKTSSTTVAVEAPVEVPVEAPFFSVSAGDSQRTDLNSMVILKGAIAAGTPAPTNVTYKWEQISGPAIALSNATSLQASFTPSVIGKYVFELTATSNEVVKTSMTTIDVEEAAFSVSAGDAQIVDLNTVATLKGAISAGNPPPSNITYQWVQRTGPSVQLSNPTSLQATFIPSITGDYEFELTATSNKVVKTSITLVSVIVPVK